MPESEVKNLTLRVRAVGDKVLKDTARTLRKISKNTKSIKNNTNGLRNIFLATFGGVGLKSITNMADGMQLLEDRVNVFTGSAIETAATMDLITEAANLTKVSIEDLGVVYNRVALATGELGLSTKQLIGFTTTLQNSFRLSGSTAAEATGAAIQLSQGLASGQLRGQELRSVLEANAVIGAVLAKQLDTTRGKLIKFAEAGTLTSDVVLKALANGAEEINRKAKELGQTFDQTLVIAMNKVRVTIGNLNKKFELNKKFAKAVEFLTDNLETLAKVMTVAVVPAFVTGLLAIGTAFKISGIGLTISALSSVIVFFDEIAVGLEKANLRITKSFLKTGLQIDKFIAKTKKDGGIFSYLIPDSVAKLSEKNIGVAETALVKVETRLVDINKVNSKTKKPGIIDALNEFTKGNFAFKLANSVAGIKELNFAFKEGLVTIKEYEVALLAIENKSIEKSFKDGKTTLDEYNDSMRDLVFELGVARGEFGALERGAKGAYDSIGTFAEELTASITDSFSTLEDQLVDFVKTGKFLFNDFAQAVLDDLTRIAIRQAVIKPITGALFGASDTGTGEARQTSFSVDNRNTAAKGKVMSGGKLTAFASGGVVNGPTLFPTKSGTGLMGEAGPEAIVPLKRTGSGDLGVQAIPSNVTVNVNNQTGAEIEVSETSDGGTRSIDITITKAVNTALNSGRFDKALSANFAVNRKGSK